MPFWKKLASGLTKGAIWAAGHPDEVIKIVQTIKEVKDVTTTDSRDTSFTKPPLR